VRGEGRGEAGEGEEAAGQEEVGIRVFGVAIDGRPPAASFVLAKFAATL
jgi:hypothetical protein